jgi:hypothetical protein
MKSISYALMLISAILLPGLAMAQYGYVRECKETVANQLNVSPLDVNAQLGAFSSNGSRIVNWRSSRANDGYGYCEFNTATGELVQAQSGEYAGPVANRSGYGNAQGQQYAQNMGYGNYRQTLVNAPHVKVDNSGRGDFHGPHKSFHIRHTWVDTRGEQAIVTLSDGDDYKISFYGPIVQRNGNRDFTMDLNNSNFGAASGTATFRLTPDDKRVEYISMNGQLKGRDFNGTFRR